MTLRVGPKTKGNKGMNCSWPLRFPLTLGAPSPLAPILLQALEGAKGAGAPHGGAGFHPHEGAGFPLTLTHPCFLGHR